MTAEENWDEPMLAQNAAIPAAKQAVDVERFEDATPVSIPRASGFTDINPESYLIGCCLMDEGATFAAALNSGLRSTDFKEPKHGLIYRVLGELKDSNAPISLDTLIPQLNGRLELAGGLNYLLEVSNPLTLGTTARASHFIQRILQDSANRRAISAAKDLLTRADKGEDVAEISGRKIDPIKLLASLRVSLATEPKVPTVRLFLAGKPIATPGNIQTLISRAKTGKTAAIGGVIAAIIAAHYDRSGMDTLGFTAPHTNEAVVLIDTEQAPYDAFTCHQRAIARAGETRDPDWLCHYAVVGYGVKELKEFFVAALKQAKEIHSGVFMAILDGVADFVNSVNDEQECNEFQTWLRALSIDYDCPILCVIHSNEAVQSGDDGRGHLGKQLTRKAESNLLLKKENGITTITSEKQRKAPITEEDGISFQWSDSAGRHVSCKIPEKKAGAKKVYHFQDYASVFPMGIKAAKRFPELLRLAGSKRPIARNTFWNLVEDATRNGEVLTDRTNINDPRYYVKEAPPIQ